MHVRALLTTTLLGTTSALMAISGSAAGSPADPGPDRIIDRNATGAAAVAALGNDLDDVARHYGRSAAELEKLLRSDSSLWVDPTGMIHAKEPLPARPAPRNAVAEQGPFPNSQTFNLHSQIDAERTIFLDFDGGPVSGTAWNDSYGVPTSSQPAFDLDGNPGAWSQPEHDLIQSVFQRVAEDFRPFRVDVTTQDPGAAALNRSSGADTEFGTRVLISPSTDAADRVCSSNCGGIAFLSIYNQIGSSYYQPAWVFPQLLANYDKYIAEAVSHEAGHNLGLFHDGTSTVGYYTGHRNWAPIMGVGYYEPVVQWSRGEYADASNTEDDIAVMQSLGAPLRVDDHGSTVATATALGTARRAVGYVERRTDLDVLSFRRTCAGSTTVRVDAFENSPNLDVRLRLLNAGSAGIGVSNPASGEASADVATGMGGSITRSLARGTYYVQVDGTGVGTPINGYNDYGSTGRFTLDISPACP